MKAFFDCLVLICTFVISVSADPAPYGPEFAACCKEKGVTDSCQQFCSFDFHPTEVIGAFTNGTCKPETDTAPYYQCLQNSKNMTACCKRYGVISSKKPIHCLDLCDGSTPIKYDPKYTLCQPVQDLIMSCGIDSHLVASSSLLSSSRADPICDLTIDSGTCNDYQHDWWYFDTFSKKCYSFTWSGCGGNANRFKSKDECLLKCGNPLDLSPTEEPAYTNIPVGESFKVYGTLSCAKDGQSVGDEGTVDLFEYDPVSADDFFGNASIIGNSFQITYDNSWWDGDYPNNYYEFYLLFKNVCGHWRVQQSGVVMPSYNVSYIVLDNVINTYTHVPDPFPRIAAKFKGSDFRGCWFDHIDDCNIADFMDDKSLARKFKIGGGGPGK